MNTAPPRPSRVLIVDDHPILRHGIAQLVQREDDMEAVAEAGSIEEALDVLARQPIELVLVDLSLDDRSGLELLKTVRQDYPEVRCLVLSMHDEKLHAERALRAGARGYVMKQEATKKIVLALRSIRDGRIYLSDSIASQMLERMTAASPLVNAESNRPWGGLTDKELEVLRLIGRGHKTGEIARLLNRSVHTVEAHRSNIKRKLGLRSAGELTRAAFEIGDGNKSP